MKFVEINKTPWCVAVNLVLVYFCYEVCRFAFLLENWNMFQVGFDWRSLPKMLQGGLLFDSSAIFYTNSLYILMLLFPLHCKETRLFRMAAKVLFVAANSACIAANLIDSVYFPFSQQRITAMTFDEFKNETNLWTIFGIEFVRHWYLVLLAVALTAFLVRFYRHPSADNAGRPLWKYYLRQTVSLVVTVPIAICCMRGASFFTATRPIAVSNAHQYVDRAVETGIVLNTPFAIIRTLMEKPQRTPVYFQDRKELDRWYSPVHIPSDSLVVRRKNVVVLIVESFAQEFVGGLNKGLDNGAYKGYTPFVDSLLNCSLTFRETFSNSGFSIDAMPAVLASIPRMDKPFVLTPFSLNKINGIAGELGKWGYHTAFFHGADNSSMGFQAFARSAGFEEYFGLDEFCADSRFGGNGEFDGTWGIWDEPFLQYFCLKMSEMKEPFMASVFTLSSHHPFAVPEQYKDVFKDEGAHALHKCIRYTDYALKRFFETASEQSWYKNTIFVITADHASSKTTHAEYKTELGHFRIPIIIYDPSGEIPSGCRDGIAQQIDIMPTLLGYLGYDRPYIAFGKDLFRTEAEDTWAINWDHLPQFIKGDYLMQFDGHNVIGVYNYRTDKLLEHNLVGMTEDEAAMKKQLQAIIQSYMERMQAGKAAIEKEASGSGNSGVKDFER